MRQMFINGVCAALTGWLVSPLAWPQYLAVFALISVMVVNSMVSE